MNKLANIKFPIQNKETQNPEQERTISKEVGFLVCLEELSGCWMARAAGTGLLALQEQTHTLPPQRREKREAKLQDLGIWEYSTLPDRAEREHQTPWC